MKNRLKKMNRHRKLTSIEHAKVPMKAYCPISLAFIGNFTMNLHEEAKDNESMNLHEEAKDNE